MNQSFNMEPATATDSIIKRECVQQLHVPPCEVEEMTNEQQAVVERYREQQDVKSKSTHSTKGPKLVYSVEQRKKSARWRNEMGMTQSGDIKA